MKQLTAHSRQLTVRRVVRRLLMLAVLAAALAACAPAEPTATATPSPVPATATLTPSETPTPPPTDTPTAIPTDTETPTLTPTYVSELRAKVVVDGRLACRRGPGSPYLYVYTFAPTSNIEVIGRMEYSNWVLAQAIGGNNPCWVNGGAEYLQFQDDRNSLPPVDPHVVMPWSSYYGPMSNVEAVRDGATVTVSYSGLVLVPERGDDSEQVPYVLEAWVCQGGEFVFTAVGGYGYAIDVVDEPGCNQTSHGRVSAAEKHGYVQFVDVDPWPAFPAGN